MTTAPSTPSTYQEKHPMFRRREPVPFAFLAESDRFRSNVTPPPRQHASPGQLAARALLGLTIVAGLAGSLVLGLPALSPDQAPAHTQQSEAHTDADSDR